MTNLVQSIRGMNDLLPQNIQEWHTIESILRSVVEQYGYQEIRLPILEKTSLFKRSIGEVTDIIEKEMYTFTDRSGESVSLRPEGTAGCVRACLEHHLFQERPLRLWYLGPMYRYERPQKGRYRQFYSFGCEVFGVSEPDIDAEILALTYRLWQQLGLSHVVSLKINSLGTSENREKYKAELVKYFEDHKTLLDEDSLRRLYTNPLRILDSKNPQLQQIIQDAPMLHHYLDNESLSHFEHVKNFLIRLDIPFEIDPRLVRGLDYYSKTVFEWQTDQLGSQNAVGGGGRYDTLVKNLGSSDVPALGFAIGLERIVALRQVTNTAVTQLKTPDVCFITQGIPARIEAAHILEQLRSEFPALSFVQRGDATSFKSQFKWADKTGARFALILGEEEISQNKMILKNLRMEQPQTSLNIEQIKTFFKKI